ncbi:redox-active disulfide protein 2 [Methanohalobium evestigatum Z-7303]|uniref:Thioredoxin n=1 Tax=Methanohalobium evestigatum (strain ATCC BAA-1072 / DSM 3721 / NBRC 107634 / OCM 161 / Z-7303) TaxID=644295 RepID=D7E7D0_METEZ|nr:thioredoxin family protein [Methanohalobium evestigatum]ADI73879.1 redox-active disulfide protein 2 [Methanohalobium evestigatum Z-7303]
MKIEVLGASGCSTCSKLKENIEKIVSEMGKSSEVEIVKIEDPVEIAKRGIMKTPVVVADGEVKFKGKVPSDDEIKEFLQ